MTIWIDVSVSKRELKLYDASVLLKTYPIAVGKVLTPTPTGNYMIMNKEYNPGGPYGVLWMGLSKQHYGIHGQTTLPLLVKRFPKGAYECTTMTSPSSHLWSL